MRFRDRPRLLWIDSLCINQSDLLEKNRQVRLMDRIYQNARRTIIWLGASGQDSENAFALMDKLVEISETSKDMGHQRPTAGSKRIITKGIKSLDSVGLPPVGHPSWKSIKHFFQRPWFTRIWVIQEVALSLDAVVMCGATERTWAQFFQLTNAILRLGLPMLEVDISVLSHINVIQWIRECKNNGQNDISLRACMTFFRRCACTDPRDMIFGLYGLANDTGPGQLDVTIDYSLSTREVYSRITRSFLRQDSSLDILSFSQWPPGERSEPSLPSWVADWSTTPDQFFGATTAAPGPGEPSRFRAGGDSTFELLPSSDECHVLQLAGIFLDQIVDLDTSVPLLYYSKKYNTITSQLSLLFKYDMAFLSWERVARIWKDEPYINGDDIFEVFWRTLLFDQLCPDYETEKPGLIALSSRLNGLRFFASSGLLDCPRFIQLLVWGLFLPRVLRRLNSDTPFDTPLISSRKLVKTESGYIG